MGKEEEIVHAKKPPGRTAMTTAAELAVAIMSYINAGKKVTDLILQVLQTEPKERKE